MLVLIIEYISFAYPVLNMVRHGAWKKDKCTILGNNAHPKHFDLKIWKVSASYTQTITVNNFCYK